MEEALRYKMLTLLTLFTLVTLLTLVTLPTLFTQLRSKNANMPSYTSIHNMALIGLDEECGGWNEQTDHQCHQKGMEMLFLTKKS